jgi:hypothetical protein
LRSLQLHLEAAGTADAADRRRRHGDDERLLDGLQAAEEIADDGRGGTPSASRSSKGSKPAKTTPALVALVKVAPEKPAKATALRTPGVSWMIREASQHHLVGAAERGAVGKLDDDDGVALVHRRDEAPRRGLQHVDGGAEQAGEEQQHPGQGLRRPTRKRTARP